MERDQELRRCVNCGRSADEVPLVMLVHRNGEGFICPQCLPALIHQPEIFVGKLSGAESLQAHAH